MKVDRKLAHSSIRKGAFMEILQFEGDTSQISWPEGIAAELEALNPIDQLRYFYKDADYKRRAESIRKEGGYQWRNYSCYYNLPVQAIELLDGKIAAVHYDGTRIVLGQTECTYYDSENNGAGYKERADYASLICAEPIEFPRDFYRIEGDTLFLNSKTPAEPHAFMYVFVAPWEREAEEPIRHVVIEDDVTVVPNDILTFMTGLETVRQPKSLNRVLTKSLDCQTYIGGVRVPKAFVSYDGMLVRVQEEVEEYRVLDHIRSIGAYAFADCPNLKRVIVHAGVREIAEGTFAAFGEGLTICCEAEAKPEGWEEDLAREGGPQVIWGYKG